jgi:hypothetical protein
MEARRKEEEWVRDWRRHTTIRQNGDGNLYLELIRRTMIALEVERKAEEECECHRCCCKFIWHLPQRVSSTCHATTS